MEGDPRIPAENNEPGPGTQKVQGESENKDSAQKKKKEEERKY